MSFYIVGLIYLVMASKPRYNKIKSVLALKAVSNKALAKKLGVTEVTVSGWCTNLKQPKLETFFEIARFLKVQPGDLINTIDEAGERK